MKLDQQVEALSRADLQAHIAHCQTRLAKVIADEQEAARQEMARLDEETEARKRAIAELAGLEYKPKGKAKPKKAGKPAFVPKAGHLYQRHGQPEVKVKGTGPRPDWWHQDIAAGRLPVDLGPAKPEVIAERKAS